MQPRPTVMNTSHRAAPAFGRIVTSFTALVISTAAVQAQTAPASTTPATTPPRAGAAVKPTTSDGASSDETVQLKEFVVSDSADLGYSTPNAIGLTRSNEEIGRAHV